MDIERNVKEALAAEAEQVAATPELWARIQAGVVRTNLAQRQQRKPVAGIFSEWCRHPVIASGVVVALILTVVLALPSTRTAVAQWLGFSFEQAASPNQLVRELVGRRPLSLSSSYEYYLYDLPRDRTSLIRSNGFRVPQPGEQLALPDGDRLTVPTYLPKGFAWQDVVAVNGSMRSEGFLSLGSMSGGGGGLEPMPDYDRSFASFLIGGDTFDHFLVLVRLREQPTTGLSVRTFFTLSPDREPGISEGPSGDAVGDAVPTPTPAPQAYRAKLQLGIIVEPSQSKSGLTLLVGPGDLHDVQVGEYPGWWYTGAWTLEGIWHDDGALTSLVWKQGDYVFQLVGENADVDMLTRVATSIP